MTDLLKQIAGHLTVMMGSAQPHIEGEEVTGYTIKTGSLHKLIGLLAGAGHPVIVPAVRWTGAPCHGMGGAHRCGDHRCTKDYCAASGVSASDGQTFSVPAGAGITVACGCIAPRPPCAVCGTACENHGTYPTCSSHPYTPDDHCQHVIGARCVGIECRNGCVRALRRPGEVA